MDGTNKKRRGRARKDRDLPFGGGSRGSPPERPATEPEAKADDLTESSGISDNRLDTRVPLGSTKKRPGDPGTHPFDYPMGHRLFRPKEFTSHNVILPNPQLASAKLLATARFKQQEMANSAAAGGATGEWTVPSANLLAEENPGWAEIVGREISKVRGHAARAGVRNESKSDSWGLDQEDIRAKPSKRKAKRAVPDDWSFDSPLPYGRFNQKSRTGPIQWMRGAFQHRRVSQAVAAVVLILFVSSLNVPWNWLFEEQVDTLKDGIVAAINSVSQPIEERAAFFIVDDFSNGIEKWLSRSGRSINRNAEGLMASGDMFLRDDTLRFSSYRMDFKAKIQSGAVGWAVRASDFDNYYGFRLVESTRNRKSSFHLERFAMVDGARTTAISSGRIPLPEDLARSGTFNKISVRVRDEQITTMVNGWGVDFWRDSRLPRGGVGLFANGGEVALVEQFTVTGNDDPWGLILYGTVETLRSVRDRISSPAVLVFTPVPLQYLALR